MKIKTMTRNRDNLPINFCTTANFLNLSKVKFIPFENSLKIKNPKKFEKKNSKSNLSEYQTVAKEEITKKDELIKKLKEKIIFLENKIKFLEKGKTKTKSRSRNDSLNNTLILKTEKSYSYKKFNQTNNNSNKSTIPVDKNLLKEKLNKRKKNLFELMKIHKLFKNCKNSSFHEYDFNKTKNNYSKNNFNYSLSSNITGNNSVSNSELKHKKKTIRIKNINSFHKSLYCISSKNSKNKNSYYIEQKNNNIKIGDKKSLNRKIKAIPKIERINQNISSKIMMSSTNYSNNISNSFKEENTSKKINIISNNENGINIINNNNSFNDIKIKLEKIKNRTKNLLELYSFVNLKNVKDKNEETKDKTDSKFSKLYKSEKFKK